MASPSDATSSTTYEFYAASPEETAVMRSMSDKFAETAAFIWRQNNNPVIVAYNYITSRISEIRALQTVKDTQAIAIKRDALARREVFFFLCLTHIHIQVFRRALAPHSAVYAAATSILNVHNLCLQIYTQRNISLARENVKVLNNANIIFNVVDNEAAQIYADTFVVSIPYPNVVSFIARQPNMQLCRTIYNTDMPQFVPSRAAMVLHNPRQPMNLAHSPPLPRLPALVTFARRSPALKKSPQVIVIDDDVDSPNDSTTSISNNSDKEQTAALRTLQTPQEATQVNDDLCATPNTSPSQTDPSPADTTPSVLSFKRKLAGDILASSKFTAREDVALKSALKQQKSTTPASGDAPKTQKIRSVTFGPSSFPYLTTIASSFTTEQIHVVHTVAPKQPEPTVSTTTQIVGTVCVDEYEEMTLAAVSYDVIDGFVFSSCATRMMSPSKRRKIQSTTYVAE